MDVTEVRDEDCEGRRDVALNILRPLVRLLSEMFTQDHELQLLFKNVEEWTQKLAHPQNCGSLEILNHMAKDVHRFLCSVAIIDFNSFRLIKHPTTEMIQMKLRSREAEDAVHLFDSAIHILCCICNNEYIHKKDPCMKENISLALDELQFLRNIRWKDFSEILAALSLRVCSSVAALVGSYTLSSSSITNIKQYMPIFRDQILIHVQHISYQLPVMDDNVVGFFDFVLDKLRKSGDQMETAIRELRFLRSNLFDVLLVYSQQQDTVVKEMDSLTSSTISLIIEIGQRTFFSIPLPQKGVYFSHKLIEVVDLLKLRAGDLFASYNIGINLSSSAPSSRTNLMDSVDSLIKNHEVSQLKPQIETYCQEMEFVRIFLASVTSNDEMKFFTARFSELAYQSSLIIGSFLRGEGSLWYHKLGLFVVSNEVKMIFRKMKHSDVGIVAPLVPENRLKDFTISAAATSFKKSFNKSAQTKLVGVKDAAIEITGLLTRGSRSRKIISIVGMAGLGKTTVANYAYEDPSINLHFHVRAWCCVSHVYKRESLLTDILSQVVGETNPSLQEASGDDLAEMLRRNLKGRKYLIVMDDMWEIKAWRDLEMVFPNDGNGSRILFTTRHRDVAPKDISQHYDLRLLSDRDSCELLWFKVFDGNTCPPQLSMISRRAARICEGLPLAVVMVAGILKRTERREESWEQVVATIKNSRGENRNHVDFTWFIDIFELSYKHLPVGLKSCFLYFAAFPEDTSISVSNLIRLWVSVGLVQEENLGHIHLEEEAENYLDELIDRSLVMIAKRSSNGGVKSCHIHNALHDFCSLKSRNEQYIMSEVPMFCGKIRWHHHSIMYHTEQNSERIVNSEGAVLIGKFDFDPRRGVHSEGANHGSEVDDMYTFTFQDKLQDKLLRVLDLGKVRMENSADTRDIILVATLVHLRFLGIRPRINEIPTEIGNLLKLETLVLVGVIGYVKLPESLWKLSRLRNVLMDHGFFDFQGFSKHFLDNFTRLYNLKSVCIPSLRNGGDDVEQHFLRRLPNLQKLACRFVYSWDKATGCCVFPVLDYLNQLASLKLSFSGMVRYPCRFSFPSSLKKLSLSNSRLRWDQTSSVMRQLPNLEVLKLLNKAFEGQQWDMEDGEMLFPKLKFLKLDSLDIQAWSAEDAPFPCLQQLVVLSCPQLEEIPDCFGEIPTLQSIEMKWCSSSAMDSVQRILQAQRDFSNDQLKVTFVGSV